MTATYKNEMVTLSGADASTFLEQVRPGKSLEVRLMAHDGEAWGLPLDIKGAAKLSTLC